MEAFRVLVPMSVDMNETNPRFFVALMLPQEADDFARQVIRDLKTQYRTRTAKAAPHITLQAPFRWPIAEVDRLEEAIAHVATTLPPIPVHLTGFGSFPPRVIYIDVEKTAELLQAQTQLTQYLQTQPQAIELKPERRTFSPHVTVASRNMNRKIFKIIWQELREQPADFQYVCDRLTLLIYNAEGWSIYREFELAGTR